MESLVGRSQDVLAMRERRQRRMVFILITIVSVLVAAGILVLVLNIFINRKYTSYTVKESASISGSSSMQYAAYDNKVLRYSRDGISAIDSSGNELWNGSYDMTSPAIDICDEYVVVADIGAKELFVYNGEDSGTEITTDYPIVQAAVSSDGVVAALLEETSSNVIQIYNPYDISQQLLAEIPTNVDEGYPVCIDISPDGVNVAAVYVSVTSGQVQSRVAFYNFSDVGKNSNCLVGAKNYNNQVISEVRFLNESDVCIFSDNGFSIWSNLKQPEQVYKKKYETEIKSAFCDEDYVGMIFETGDTDNPYNMKVYDLTGKKVLDMDFADEYTSVSMYGKEIMMNSTSQCTIYRINGVKRFSCSIDGKILHFFPAKGVNRYYFITDSRIEKIKLKK